MLRAAHPFARLLIVLVLAVGSLASLAPPTPLAAADDGRLYAQTGFKIRNPAFLNFFDRRGGVRTFGYPTSREFSFQGARVQFFQRGVMQIRPDGTVTTLNLLDPGLMPYTRMNSATFPGVDFELLKAAPPPGSPNYGAAILDYVKASAPNIFEAVPVSFHQTFLHTVTAYDAYPDGKGDLGLLPGYDLELWGVPTSPPAYDPKNRNFIYQRFQRGIMHHDAASKMTQGLLLADYLKAIITGANLPPDLEEQARSSSLYRQYDASKPQWVARPVDLPNTDLTMAFEREPAIVIDPGHGGTEIGSSFKFADGTVLREKDLTLVVGKRVAAILQEKGYVVILTRTADRVVNFDKVDLTNDKKVSLDDELQARLDMANRAEATLFVSIHFNGSTNPALSGTEAYYCAQGPYTAQSQRLAGIVQQSILSELKAVGYGPNDRGAKPDERAVGIGNHFYVLNPTEIRPVKAPAVLVEALFLTNADEAAKVRDPKIQEAIAQGYVKGIEAYYAQR